MLQEQRKDIIPGLVLFNPFQNARTDEMIADWQEDRRTPFNDVISEFGRSVGHKIATDPKTQVALIAFMTAAAYALIWRLGKRPEITVGHSIGENASMMQSGVLTIEKGAQIVLARQEICTSNNSLDLLDRGMMAITRLAPGEADRIIEYFRGLRTQGIFAEIANVNSSGQVVASGIKSHIRRAIDGFVQDYLGSSSSPRTIELPIDDAYHSTLMQPKQEKFIQEVERIAGDSFQSPDGILSSPMKKNATGDSEVKTRGESKLVVSTQLTNGANLRDTIREIIERYSPRVLASSDPKRRLDDILKDNLAELGLLDIISVVNFSTPQRLEKAVPVIEAKCLA